MKNKLNDTSDDLNISTPNEKKSFDNKEIEKLFEEVSLDDQVNINNSGFFEKIKYLFLKFNNSRVDFLNKAPLVSYSIKRILYAILTLYIAISVIFILLRLVTPDSTFIMDIDLERAGIVYDSEEYWNLLNIRKTMLGVDGPLISQIFSYLSNITPLWPSNVILNPRVVFEFGEFTIVGDETRMFMYLGVIFGQSTGFPRGYLVQEAFSGAIPVSFMIGGLGVLISYILGVPLGILSAKNKEKWNDNAINGLSLILLAVPAVVIIKLLYEFSIYFLGAGALWDGASSSTFTRMFPIIGIVLLIMPMIIVNTRRFVVDEMTADYTKFALSKGLSAKYVFFVHVFRNAGVRLVRDIPIIFIITLFGSSILVEQHWTIPGMSQFILAGVRDKDTFLVLGYIYLSASAGILSTLAGDLALAVLDPRVKLTSK